MGENKEKLLHKNYGAVDLAKLLFAYGIVGIHSGLFWDFTYGFYEKAMLLRLGVPFFFLCAGYFFALGVTNENKKQRCLEYGKRLLTPYLLWNLFYVPYAQYFGGYLSAANLLSATYYLLTGRSMTVMWFIGALFWCVLYFYIFDNGTKRRLQWVLTVFFLLYLIGMLFNTHVYLLLGTPFEFISSWLTGTFRSNSDALFCGFFYFALGFYLNRYGAPVFLQSMRNKLLILTAGMLGLFLECNMVKAHLDVVSNYEYYVLQAVVVPVLLLVLLQSSDYIKGDTRKIRKLSSYVYYTHISVIYAMSAVQKRWPSLITNRSVPQWLLLCGCTTVLILMFFRLQAYIQKLGAIAAIQAKKLYSAISHGVAHIGPWEIALKASLVAVEALLSAEIIRWGWFSPGQAIAFVAVGIASAIVIRRKKLGSVKIWIAVGLLSLYGTFSLTAGQMLTDLNAFIDWLSFLRASTYVALWMLLPVAVAFQLLENFACKVQDNALLDRKGTLQIVLLTTVPILLPALLYLWCYNPAITSVDTVVCMYNARQIGQGIVLSWHPPFYALILRGLLEVCDSVIWLALVQLLLFLLVQVDCMLFLRRKGVPLKWLVLVSVCIGITPVNLLYLITIWKDILYAVSMLLLTLQIAKLVLDREYYQKQPSFYISLAVALLCVGLLRQNGIVVFIISAFILLLCFRNCRMLTTLLCTVTLALCIRGPLYAAMNVQNEPGKEGGAYLGLAQDILAVYYTGGELDEEALDMVSVWTDGEPENYDYTAYWSNASYALNVPAGTVVRCYAKTFLNNPVPMMKSAFCRLDMAWDLLHGKNSIVGCVNYTGITTDATSLSGISMHETIAPRTDRALTKLLDAINTRTQQSPLLFNLLWHTGVWLFLEMILLGYCLWKKLWSMMLVFVPLSAQMLSLALSTGWSDYRYVWGFMLLYPFLLLATVSKRGLEEFTGVSGSVVRRQNIDA